MYISNLFPATILLCVSHIVKCWAADKVLPKFFCSSKNSEEFLKTALPSSNAFSSSVYKFFGKKTAIQNYWTKINNYTPY